MGEAGVDHAIVYAQYEYGDPALALNQAVADHVKQDPKRFSGFGTILMEHFRPMRAVRQVAQFPHLGLAGVNFQPSFFGVPNDDRHYHPVYAKTAEVGFAIAVHTGINYSIAHPIKNVHPLVIGPQVACDFPELMFIACHTGWRWSADMATVRVNILTSLWILGVWYLNTSAWLDSGWEIMRQCMNSLLAEQVLFATVWPVFTMNRALKEWQALGLKSEVQKGLLGNDAERLMHLQLECT